MADDTVQQVANQLGVTSSALDVIAVTDSAQIKFLAEKTADQMNAQSGGPVFTDLSERITDIIIQTSVQGASFLEVHIVDPLLALLVIPKHPKDPSSTFISVADDGYLDPPIEVDFPPHQSHGPVKSTWRLCSLRASTMDAQAQAANLILTFEDKIASVLRQVDAKIGGVKQSNQGEGLDQFMQRVVGAANQATGQNIQPVVLIDQQKDPNSASSMAATLAALGANAAAAATGSIPGGTSKSAVQQAGARAQAAASQATGDWLKSIGGLATSSAALSAVEQAASATIQALEPGAGTETPFAPVEVGGPG